MSKQKNEEDMKEKVYELYHLNQQVQAMQQQLKHFESASSELNILKESLDDLEKSKDKEIFSHIGGGVFVKSEIKDKKKVLVNVGGNILVNKDVKEAKDIIEKQGEDTKKIVEKIGSELELFAKQVGSLEKELEGLNKEK